MEHARKLQGEIVDEIILALSPQIAHYSISPPWLYIGAFPFAFPRSISPWDVLWSSVSRRTRREVRIPVDNLVRESLGRRGDD